MDEKRKSFLAFSFGAGFNSPNIPIATFHQGDRELTFIIDTGSDDNIIDSNIVNELEYAKTGLKRTLTGIGGTIEVEQCVITLEVDNDKCNATFLISDLSECFKKLKEAHAIQLHGMIGSKFLRENKIKMDFNNFVAYTKE